MRFELASSMINRAARRSRHWPIFGSRFASLTPRERQMMALLAEGRMTKQIAGETGISAMTVRIHRNQVVSKMGARSTADLVRMADKLGLPSSKGQAD